MSLYQPTPVTSRNASPYGRSESNGFSTPQSCGTRTSFQEESSNSGLAQLKAGAPETSPLSARSRIALIAFIVRFVPAAGSSAFTNRQPVLSATFSVAPNAAANAADMQTQISLFISPILWSIHIPHFPV